MVGSLVAVANLEKYVNEHVHWYDYCDIDNCNSDMIENLVEEIGYECRGKIRVCWCVPGIAIWMDGVSEIKRGDDTMKDNMVSCVRMENTIISYFWIMITSLSPTSHLLKCTLMMKIFPW